MRTSLKAALVALTIGTVLTTTVPAAAAPAERNGPGIVGDLLDSLLGNGDRRGLDAVGLVDGTTLVGLNTASARTRGTMRITGLAGDVRLVGIDYRVQDGRLYGVGDAGGVYTIGDRGAATKVLQLSIALSGTSFAVDFNPAANALRILSDTGQNLRQPFATAGAATVADTPVAYSAGTPATGITAAAYTNNDLDPATATTLFDLDTALDQVAIQSPANAGTLVATGALGVDATGDAGFDLYSELDGGRTVAVSGFATLRVGGRYALYGIDPLTGPATRIGQLDKAVTDLAIALDQR